MPFTFSAQELIEIQGLYTQALTDKANGISGSFAPVYTYIAERLTTFEPDPNQSPDVGQSPADADPAVRQVALWFAGASQVTAGEGIFSDLIRQYTFRQGELRY